MVQNISIKNDAANPITVQKLGFKAVTRCPTTHEQVHKAHQQCFTIPNRKATWWHCPACQGWHIEIKYDVFIDLESASRLLEALILF